MADDPVRGHRAPAALLILFAMLVIAYRSTVPLFETPDEPSHLQYIAFISLENRPPASSAGAPEVPGEGMQPPLYYWIGVPLFRWVADDARTLFAELHRANLANYLFAPKAIRANTQIRRLPAGSNRRFAENPDLSYLRPLRWPSLLFGLLAVAFTYLAVARVAGPVVALLAASLIALNPQFLFLSSSISNDAAATAVGAGVFWIVAVALTDVAGVGRRHYLWLAVASALAVLTKNSALSGLPIAGLALVLADRRAVAQRLSDLGLAAILFGLLAAPWMVWSTVNRGDPFSMAAVWHSALRAPRHESFGGLTRFFVQMYPTWTFESYWARFGWLNIRAPGALYLAYLALTLAGCVGFAAADRSAASRSSGPSRALRLYLIGTISMGLGVHLWLNFRVPAPQGRHLFPIAPEIACLLAIGIGHWLQGSRTVLPRGRVLAVVAGLLASALYCLAFVITPAYR